MSARRRQRPPTGSTSTRDGSWFAALPGCTRPDSFERHRSSRTRLAIAPGSEIVYDEISARLGARGLDRLAEYPGRPVDVTEHT